MRLRELKHQHPLLTTGLEQLSGAQLLAAMNQTETLDSALQKFCWKKPNTNIIIIMNIITTMKNMTTIMTITINRITMKTRLS